MVVFILLNFLVSDFQQKWFIPQGISDGAAGRICICDTDRDGNFEFIFTTYGGSFTIYFYELHLPDTWEVDSFPYLNSPLLWDIGAFDLDGLYDLIMQCGSTNPYWVGITIFESPDSFSYPTQEMWRDTVGQAAVTPISVCDIDQDGLTEIVKVGANGIDFVIYESIGNNLYDRIYEDTIQGIMTPAVRLFRSCFLSTFPSRYRAISGIRLTPSSTTPLVQSGSLLSRSTVPLLIQYHLHMVAVYTNLKMATYWQQIVQVCLKLIPLRVLL